MYDILKQLNNNNKLGLFARDKHSPIHDNQDI